MIAAGSTKRLKDLVWILEWMVGFLNLTMPRIETLDLKIGMEWRMIELRGTKALELEIQGLVVNYWTFQHWLLAFARF